MAQTLELYDVPPRAGEAARSPELRTTAPVEVLRWRGARRRRRRAHPVVAAALLVSWGALSAGLLAREEAARSTVQARAFSRVAAQATYSPRAAPSEGQVYPGDGPYDARLGYDAIPARIKALKARGFALVAQARQSEVFRTLGRLGFEAPYTEKHQAGLTLKDQRGRVMTRTLFPGRLYKNFEAIPPVVVDILVFLENRELMRPEHPKQNPVVEWDRLAYAGLIWGADRLGWHQDVPGGSTLATQIEKFRHSPEGRTHSVKDKGRQMISASLRAYQGGEETAAAREGLVLAYVNGVPLAGTRGWGDVHGLGDGLWAWFGRDFDEVNAALAGERGVEAQALATRQALTLMIAQRSPTRLLVRDTRRLGALTDAHLRVLRDRGILSPQLAAAALALADDPRAQVRRHAPALPERSFVERKAIDASRVALMELLDAPTLYALDRLDAEAQTTIDAPVQAAVSRLLEHDMHDPKLLKARGFEREHLLRDGDPSKVTYSFTLYERVGREQQLRVQVDTHDQPMNINDSAKLDLGSTAKLRTLVTYLQLVADLHARYSKLSRDDLLSARANPDDVIARWVIRQLRWRPDLPLDDLLERAMNRRYSASPYEAFMTGGGLHRFENFNDRFDGSILSVRVGFRHSSNLVLIRLMRDLVHHYKWSKVGPELLRDPSHPKRRAYLERYARHDAEEYLGRFWDRYAALRDGPAHDHAIRDRLVKDRHLSALQLAVAFRTVTPHASARDFAEFAAAHLDADDLPTREALEELFTRHSPDHFSLNDRGYLTDIHPLELWMAARLAADPALTLSDLHAQKARVMPDVYDWLYKPGRTVLQNRKIRTMLEFDAFDTIHAQWRATGYPFEALVPSLATAIGASADRPSALAELIGVIQSDGMRYPTRRITHVSLARGTPYAAELEARPTTPKRVLAPEVAATARAALLDVVANGTGRRVHEALGKDVTIGGKTGTGDHRFETFNRFGQVLTSRAVNRTGTFCFMIEDRFFGVITAYVSGPQSDQYTFTSALAAETFNQIAPLLKPLMASPPVRQTPRSEGNEACSEGARFESWSSSGRLEGCVPQSPPLRAPLAPGDLG